MITFVPTLAVMGLFAFYREEVMCLWGCNPFVNGLLDSAKDSFQIANTYSQTFARTFMTHATDWYSSTSDVSKQIILQWVQRIMTRVQEIDNANLALYLYFVYTFAFAMVLYAGIVVDARDELREELEEEAREERKAFKKKKRVYIAPSPRRPITRSMTQERITQNVY